MVAVGTCERSVTALAFATLAFGLGGFGRGAAGTAFALATFALAGLFCGGELVTLRQRFDGEGRSREVDAAKQGDAQQAKAGLVWTLDTGHGASPEYGHAARAIEPGNAAIGLFVRADSFGLRCVSGAYQDATRFVSEPVMRGGVIHSDTPAQPMLTAWLTSISSGTSSCSTFSSGQALSCAVMLMAATTWKCTLRMGAAMPTCPTST
ncbi:hypothetical protein D3C76_850400 [compost metagenome]